MLTNSIAFEELMKLLRKIKPQWPLPLGFEAFLWCEMIEPKPFRGTKVLVRQSQVPQHAYYIISGYVYVYYFDDAGDQIAKCFYGENRIVAFLSFLEQQPSPYYLVAGKGTVLSTIDITTMEQIYRKWAGMKEFAQLVVLQYEESKEKAHLELLAKSTKDRVREFYQRYPCLWPPASAQLDNLIAAYLNMSVRTLRILR